MPIAVTGAYGQLGGELCRQLGDAARPLDIDQLDLTDGPAVLRTLREIRPKLVINCAAYTQVDQAESEPEACRAVNAAAVEYLVRACGELDCPLVQISTDYVFGGDARGEGRGTRSEDSRQATPAGHDADPAYRPWREDDPPAPQGVYARTKLEGERAAARYRKHLIMRTCGLYARPSDPRARNFVRTMLRLAASGREVRVVGDQHCTPSYVPHVARAVLFLAGLGGLSQFSRSENGTVPFGAAAPWGTYHVTSRGATTWYDFAAEIFRRAGLEVSLQRITTAQYAAPAPRPAYSVLDTTTYHRLGGPAMPDWKEALAEYFEEAGTNSTFGSHRFTAG
jgi:dTDP-4-dehydrorhamnose reductase